ncbi:MAG: hypothetical protein CHACPFDD_00608 [Phycisphaerae bacterium]|nr:hypothetical protein [Phycisphaerae bacterium]
MLTILQRCARRACERAPYRAPGSVSPYTAAPPIRPAVRRIVVLAGVLLLLSSGCSPPSRPARSDAAPLPPLDTSTPEAAAKSLLAALKARLVATRAHDAAGDQAARARIAELVAVDVIYQRLPSGARRLTTPEAAARSVSDTWPALIAFYVEHLNVQQIERAVEAGGHAHVHVATTGGSDAARLKIECANLGGAWRVARIEFDPPHASSQPTSD